MSQNFKKIINEITSFNDYYLLAEHKNYLIVGTLCRIRRHFEVNNSYSFHPYSTNKEQTLPLYFYLTTDNTVDHIKNQGVPILLYDDQKGDLLSQLDEFIIDWLSYKSY